MKTLIVYDSLYGNTEKIAQAIAEVCRLRGQVQLVRAGDLTRLEPGEDTLLFVGGPTHRQTMSEAMKALLDAVPAGSLRGVQAAAFDTRYEMAGWLLMLSAGTAAAKIARRLRRQGANLLARPESFLIERDHEGPLLAGELERAGFWAESVLDKVAGSQRAPQAPRQRQTA